MFKLEIQLNGILKRTLSLSLSDHAEYRLAWQTQATENTNWDENEECVCVLRAKWEFNSKQILNGRFD